MSPSSPVTVSPDDLAVLARAYRRSQRNAVPVAVMGVVVLVAIVALATAPNGWIFAVTMGPLWLPLGVIAWCRLLRPFTSSRVHRGLATGTPEIVWIGNVADGTDGSLTPRYHVGFADGRWDALLPGWRDEAALAECIDRLGFPSRRPAGVRHRIVG